MVARERENIRASHLREKFYIPKGVSPEEELTEHHRADHFGRVLALSVPLFQKLQRAGTGVTWEYDFQVMGWFSVLHDAFLRKNNYDHHGTLAAYYVMNRERSPVPTNLRQVTALAIYQHVPRDPDGGLPFISRVCKDLDALDRARLSDEKYKLKPSYLRLSVSHNLIFTAQQLYDKSQEFINNGWNRFDGAIEAAVELGILAK